MQTLTKSVLGLSLILSSLTITKADEPEIYLAGDALDTLECGKQSFNEHLYSVVAEKIDRRKYKIYSDGKLEGLCKKKPKLKRISYPSERIVTDFTIVEHLEWKEVLALENIGLCHPNFTKFEMRIDKQGQGQYVWNASESEELSNLFKERAIEKGIELDLDFDEPIAKAQASAEVLKEMVAEGYCGLFNDLSSEQKETETAEILVFKKVGINAWVAKGKTYQEIKELGYGPSSFVLALDLDLDGLMEEVQFSLKDIVNAGIFFKDIRERYSVEDLISEGFKIRDLTRYSSDGRLYTFTQIKEFFTVADFLSEGFDWGIIKTAGYTKSEMKESKATPADLHKYYNSVSGLLFTPQELKDLYSVSDWTQAGKDWGIITAAGYTVLEMKNAGATPRDLLKYYNSISGYPKTATELNPVYSAKEFIDSGIDWGKTASAGYSPAQLKVAGATPGDLLKYYNSISGYPFKGEQLKDTFTVAEFIASGKDWGVVKNSGYTIREMKNAGATVRDLMKYYNSASGYLFTASQLKSEYSISDFIDSGKDWGIIKSAGFSLDEKVAAGASIKDLVRYYNSASGYIYYLKDLKSYFTLSQFKSAGYDYGSITNIGFTLKDLVDDGASIADLTRYYNSASGYIYSLNDLKSHFSINDFKSAGNDWGVIKGMGYTLQEMINAGAGVADLLRYYNSASGYIFVASDLKEFFTVSDFRNASKSWADIKRAGYSLPEMKAGGASIRDLSNYNSSYGGSLFSHNEIKNYYSKDEYRSEGFSEKQISDIFGSN